MLQSSESETEILLGNKQLLGIFLVVAVLLGISFTGGYLVGRGGTGRGTGDKKAVAIESNSTADSSLASSGGQTHTLAGETTLPAAASGGADSEAAIPSPRGQSDPVVDSPKVTAAALGSTKRSSATVVLAPIKNPTSSGSSSGVMESGYLPAGGTQYLQVAAVGKDEAEAVADVLHKKGFHAHAVPKPGNVKLYRVIIGPVKDAGELSSTRDALRKTGFREVIVQRY